MPIVRSDRHANFPSALPRRVPQPALSNSDIYSRGFRSAVRPRHPPPESSPLRSPRHLRIKKFFRSGLILGHDLEYALIPLSVQKFT